MQHLEKWLVTFKKPITNPSKRALAVSLGLAALIVQLFITFRVDQDVRRGRQDTDFKTFYYSIGEAQKGNNIYTMHSRHVEWKVFPYMYPPTLTSLIIPLRFFSYPNALFIWNLFSVLLFGLSGYLLHRWLAAMGSTWEGLPVGIGMLALGWVCEENLVWGQVNVWLLTAIAGFLLLLQKRRFAIAGFLLGGAFAIKLYPLALMVVCMAYGLRPLLKALAGFVVSLVVFLFLVPGIIYGFSWTWQTNAYFFKLALLSVHEGIRVLGWGDNCSNRSMLAALNWAFGKCGNAWGRLDLETIRLINRIITTVLILVTSLCGAAATIFRLLQHHRNIRGKEKNAVSDPPRGLISALAIQGLLVAMLVPPISWPHHWVMLLVAMAVSAFYIESALSRFFKPSRAHAQAQAQAHAWAHARKARLLFLVLAASFAGATIWITGAASKHLVDHMWAIAGGMLLAWLMITACVVGEITLGVCDLDC